MMSLMPIVLVTIIMLSIITKNNIKPRFANAEFLDMLQQYLTNKYINTISSKIEIIVTKIANIKRNLDKDTNYS